MNGTDLPTINIYGSTGDPAQTSVGVYSSPRDPEHVKRRIAAVEDLRIDVKAELASNGFDLKQHARLFPFYSHRYVVCEAGCERTPVLSIWVGPVDAVVYGDSLEAYLKHEFLPA